MFRSTLPLAVAIMALALAGCQARNQTEVYVDPSVAVAPPNAAQLPNNNAAPPRED